MEKEPAGPYVYQPYGSQDDIYWANKRIFGVGGVSILTDIKGLTREEAEIIVKALTPKKEGE